MNQSTWPVEAVYIFPIDKFANKNSIFFVGVFFFFADSCPLSRAAVSGFEVEIDGVVTTAVVQEKAQARATYESAIAHGDSAQLLEEKRSDVFQMSVGNLKPGQYCTINIT